jgi:hypothetical protein
MASSSAPSALATAELTAGEAATAGAAESEPSAAGLRVAEIAPPEGQAVEGMASSSAPSALVTAELTAGEAATAEAEMVRGTPGGRNEPWQDAGDVVLDYCAAVRGILNDDQGGPLKPPGLRMAAALGEVRASLERNLAAKKGGRRKAASTAGCLY